MSINDGKSYEKYLTDELIKIISTFLKQGKDYRLSFTARVMILIYADFDILGHIKIEL